MPVPLKYCIPLVLVVLVHSVNIASERVDFVVCVSDSVEPIPGEHDDNLCVGVDGIDFEMDDIYEL